MKCFHPKKIHFGSALDEYLSVPCGKCRACRAIRARDWTYRLTTELPYWNKSCFITLTYDERLEEPTLNHEDVQKYMKRMRKQLGGLPLKYFVCGEYGGENGRPHYHQVLYGWEPPDGKRCIKSGNGPDQWTSDILTKLWSHGQVVYGLVTAKSCAYVAGYVNKKLSEWRYEDCGLRAPYIACSKGIGLRAALDNREVITTKLSVNASDGNLMRVPRYIRKKLDIPPDPFLSSIQQTNAMLTKLYPNIKGKRMHELLVNSLRQKEVDMEKYSKIRVDNRENLLDNSL